jgi:hypothetical protein
METPSLPTIEDIKSVAHEIDQAWQAMDQRYNRLRAMEEGPLKAAIALKYSRELKDYLDIIDVSPLAAQKKRTYEVYKYALDVYNRATKRADIFLQYCKEVRSNWESERLRLIEKERREKESQANLFAAQQRQAEVDHLKKIGKAAEAEVIAAAPITPVTIRVDQDAGKPEGESLVPVWVPKCDDRGEIEFTDLTAFLVWVASTPAHHHLVKPQYGPLKKLLTANRGIVQPPGLVVEKKYEPRTLREVRDD